MKTRYGRLANKRLNLESVSHSSKDNEKKKQPNAEKSKTKTTIISEYFSSIKKVQDPSKIDIEVPSMAEASQPNTRTNKTIELLVKIDRMPITNNLKRTLDDASANEGSNNSKGQKFLTNPKILLTKFELSQIQLEQLKIIGNKFKNFFIELKIKLKKKISGGLIVNDVLQADLLVTTRIIKTGKFVGSVARGIPIVSPEWIEMSIRENKFLGKYF